MSDEKRYADGWLVDPRDHLAEPMWKEFCGEDEDRKFGDLEPWERDEFRAMVRIAQDYYDPKIASLEADLELLRRVVRLQHAALHKLGAYDNIEVPGREEAALEAQKALEQDVIAANEFRAEHNHVLLSALRGKP